MWRSVAIVCVVLAAGCSTTAPKDETANWSAQKLYTEAKNELAEGNFQQAITLYEKLEAKFPYGRYAQQAQIEVAYAYHKQGDRVQALAACERFLRLHPDHPNIDYVYYLRGLINFNEDQGYLSIISQQDMTERDPKGLRESFESLKEMVTRFPQSKYAPDATARMAYLVNAMAWNEVHVARYYYNRGAWLAAANRAQYAVNIYRDAPAIEEALFIMVKSYDKLEMADLRDDADRVLRKNFPKSVYLARGLNREEPWWKLW